MQNRDMAQSAPPPPSILKDFVYSNMIRVKSEYTKITDEKHVNKIHMKDCL